MNDNGNHDDSFCFRNTSEEDRFGVAWGKELIGDDEEEAKQKRNNVKNYYSFYLNGREYCQNDIVYLRSQDGPPYIGKIGKLFEILKEKRKHMHVRWFCRPCELPEGLSDVDYSENCKEIFVMWGDGAKNRNHPACTMKHCKVVCTAEEKWNTNFPSIEQIAAADHLFHRVYDQRTGTLRPLEDIVKKYGEHFVTGKGEQTQGSDRKLTSKTGKMSAGVRIHPEGQPRPLAMRASSDFTSLSVDSEIWGLPRLVMSPDSPPGPLHFVGVHRESSVSKASTSVPKPGSHEFKEARSAHSDAAKERTVLKSVRSAGTADLQKKRPHMDSSDTSLRTLVKPVSSAGPAHLQKKRPRVDSSDASLPKQQAQKGLAAGHFPPSGVGDPRAKPPRKRTTADPNGINVLLNRERQKSTVKASSELNSTEVKKRPRADSPARGTEEGKLKKLKLSASSHFRHVAFTEEVTKVKDNVSQSRAIVPKSGELRSPRVAAGNLLENSSGQEQAQGPEDHHLPTDKLERPSSDIHDVVLTKGVTTCEDNVSPSTASNLKSGELRSAQVAERKLPEYSSDERQVQGPEALPSPTNKKQDDKVSSPPVGESRLSARTSDECFSNLDPIGKQMPALSTELEQQDPRSFSPKVVLPDVTGEEQNHWARKQSSEAEMTDATAAESGGHTGHSKHGYEHIAEDSRHLLRNGANTKSSDLEQNQKLVSRSPAYALEIQCSLSMQHDVGKMSRTLPKAQKLSAFNHGKVHTDDVVPQTFKKNTLVSKGNQNVVGESQVKLADKRAGSAADEVVQQISKKNTLGSKENQNVVGESQVKPAVKKAGSPANEVVPPTIKKNTVVNEGKRIVLGLPQFKIAAERAGSPLGNLRHAGMGSLHKASEKRPNELELSNPKIKAMRKSDTQPCRKEAQQVREEVETKMIGVVAKNLPVVSSKKRSDGGRSGNKSRLSPQGSGEKVLKKVTNIQNMLKPVLAAKGVGRAPAIDTTVDLSVECRKEIFEPRRKIFNFPWEESLRIALEQGKALHLQNLDPWFSSAEIEAMLQELLEVCCDVRMLPPKDFSCYTSGQALVLFRSQNTAIEALQKLTDNWLIWSKDERPVLVSMADAKTAALVSSGIHGFYNAEIFASRDLVNRSEAQKNAVATSHCSQPNTVEYEMGIQWRLLQDRQEAAWNIAAQDQKAAIDDLVNKIEKT